MRERIKYGVVLCLVGLSAPSMSQTEIAPGSPASYSFLQAAGLTSGFEPKREAIEGGACDVLDEPIGLTTTNTLLTCVGGVFKRPGGAYWGGNAATYSSLPGCSSANLGETRQITDIGGVYTCNGLTWAPSLNSSGALALPGQLNVAGAIQLKGRLTTDEFLEVKGIATEGQPCPQDGVIGKDSNGRLISCQGGYWLPSSRAPRSYRYIFETSQKWKVPVGVKSAYVTMAGGGGSGLGWRVSNMVFPGHSGGYVFSHPVNFIDGETLDIVVGAGGKGYAPYKTAVVAAPGHPYYVYAPPASGEAGLGGYPGGSSMVISPTAGILLECAGGSGAAIGGVDSYEGSIVAGNVKGATTGSGSPAYASPNRVAAGSYAVPNGPGKCGAGNYGIGNAGAALYGISSGTYPGGKTPFGYGSGGDVGRSGCYVTTTYVGTCVFPGDGRSGVVIIDVSY